MRTTTLAVTCDVCETSRTSDPDETWAEFKARLDWRFTAVEDICGSCAMLESL